VVRTPAPFVPYSPPVFAKTSHLFTKSYLQTSDSLICPYKVTKPSECFKAIYAYPELIGGCMYITYPSIGALISVP
jgi:hypothetical protein